MSGSNIDKAAQNNAHTYKSLATICFIVFNISLSSFYFGYTVIYYASIPPETINHLYHIDLNNALAQGLLNGAISLGGLIGSCISSLLLEHLSRRYFLSYSRRCLLLLDFCSILVGILIYIPNFYTFLTFRLIQGICAGAFSSIAPLIIKQIAPLEISGMMGNFSQLNLSFGVLFCQIFSFILKKSTGDQSGQQYWIFVFGFTLLTQAIQILVLIFVFPFETPKYLLLNSEKKECEDLIHRIYKEQFWQQVYCQKIADITHDGSEDENQIKNSQNVVDHHPVIPLAAFVAIMLTSLQQLSGINAIVIYSSDIAKKIFTGQIVQLMSILLNFTVALFAFLSIFVQRNFGRKILILIGFCLTALSSAAITFGYIQENETSSYIILIGMITFMMAYGATLGPIGWAYLPEIIPPKGMSYVVAFNWITNSLVVMLFPIITENLLHGNPCLLFLFFTCACIFGVVFNYKFMIETKDKTEKQIRQEYIKAKIC